MKSTLKVTPHTHFHIYISELPGFYLVCPRLPRARTVLRAALNSWCFCAFLSNKGTIYIYGDFQPLCFGNFREKEQDERKSYWNWTWNCYSSWLSRPIWNTWGKSSTKGVQKQHYGKRHRWNHNLESDLALFGRIPFEFGCLRGPWGPDMLGDIYPR